VIGDGYVTKKALFVTYQSPITNRQSWDAHATIPVSSETMSDDYQRIISTLSGCRRVLLTTHARPDGDALGSCAAMALGLAKRGIAAKVLLLTHLPTKYAFIFRDHGIQHFDAERGWPAELSLDAFDALLVLDTGTWSQLPGLRERIEHWPKPKLVVDHHLTQEDWADVKLVVTEAAAAGEIVAELLDQWPIEFDSAIASALFLAIASDTGWFQFSNTRPYTMRLAARLMEAGVNIGALHQALYQNERPERVALQTRAQTSLELLADDRLAVMHISKSDFEQTNAAVADTENLINIPLQIRTVAVSLLFTEPKEPGPIRVSLRSKGQIDVARFAERFGGGGHSRAAGLTFKGTLAEAQDKVVAAMLESLGAGG
jgi:phosphoesterase RecJ-like protein